MNTTFQKSIKVGNTDTYTYTVPKEWLGNELITSHSVIVDDKVTKNTSAVTDNVVGVSLTATKIGSSKIIFRYSTGTGRSDCVSLAINVTDEC